VIGAKPTRKAAISYQQRAVSEGILYFAESGPLIAESYFQPLDVGPGRRGK